MDMKCLIAPGVIVLLLILRSWSLKWGEARQARWNNAMNDSYLYQPSPVFVPGEIVVEETVPVTTENSTDVYIREMNEREARQRERCAEQRRKRAEKRAAEEKARRTEMDAILKKAYGSIGKEEKWTGW